MPTNLLWKRSSVPLFALPLAILLGAAFIKLIVLKLVARARPGRWLLTPCPPWWAWFLGNPFRCWYARPVLERCGIRPGERVLELGSGPGVFTVPAGLRVGPRGRLMAMDLQPAMTRIAARRVRGARLANVDVCVGDAESLPLADASIDRAILVTSLAEIADRQRALREVWRVLRPGGTLSITEEFMDPHYLFCRETTRCAEACGFCDRQLHGGLWLYTLNYLKPLDAVVA